MSWDLRILSQADAQAVLMHWLALPAGLRYMRFGHLYPDTVLAELAAALDFDSDLFCGLFSPDGDLAALAQAAPDEAGAWELAFSVLPNWQHNGFARTLGERLSRMLAARGARLLRVRCLANNEPMRCLALTLGFTMREEGGELFGEKVPQRQGGLRRFSVGQAG